MPSKGNFEKKVEKKHYAKDEIAAINKIIAEQTTKSDEAIATIASVQIGRSVSNDIILRQRKKIDVAALPPGFQKGCAGGPGCTPNTPEVKAAKKAVIKAEKEKRSKERKLARQEKIAATIREKRAAQQAKKASEKPQRNPRYIQEEREAWEWLQRITDATAVAMKKRRASGSDLAHDFVHSGIQNVMDDNVWIGGVQAHVTNDIRVMVKQAYSRRSIPTQIEVLPEYSCGGGKIGRQGGGFDRAPQA